MSGPTRDELLKENELLEQANADLVAALAQAQGESEVLRTRLQVLESRGVREALTAHLAGLGSANPEVEAGQAIQHLASWAQVSTMLPDSIVRALMALREQTSP